MWPCAAVVLAVLTGCRFEVNAGVGGAPGDGAAGSDGASADATPPTDAVMVAPGVAVPSTTATPITVLGGTGGGQIGTLACAAEELPIGLRFDVTPGPIPNHANQLLLVNVHVRCGRVARLSNGTWQTTATAEVTHQGGTGSNPNACDPYYPTTPSLDARCASGSVLVGVLGNQVDSTLYNTVAIRCALLALDGSVTAATTTIDVTGTGSYSNQPEMSTCPAGTAIVEMTARAGCGQDGLIPACAALEYAP